MSRARHLKPVDRRSQVSIALRRRMSMFAGVGVFSGVINLLALTGSMYMLQVYDRVIPSRSVPTLVGLSILMLGLYLINGLLDMLRNRIMARIGLRFDKDLRARVFDIVLLMPLKMNRSDRVQPINDLDQIRSFLATPGPVALFDMPWIPVFILIIYWMHPWLGWLAIAGALLLLTLAILTEILSRKSVRAAASSGAARQVFGDAARRNAEVIRALGMGERMKAIWLEQSRRHLVDHLGASDVVGGFGSASKVLRMILQSAMLGLGAYLVILGEASAGIMIAGSILLSRALAPIEIAIANWRGFVAARQSYRRLQKLFALAPDEAQIMQLPPPNQRLTVENLWVAAPGQSDPIVHNIGFSLQAGAGLGIIGRSACGKSTLARALVGVWEPMASRGAVRLDGAALDQWSPVELGHHIGYLPQEIELFDGTIAQNIARFDPEMSSEAILAAAHIAGVHDMILQMQNGYDTGIGQSGEALSAGQRQRIGLARALYNDPFLVVLDEPNSNLDVQGEAALGEAIGSVRSRGGIVIVIAHRASALARVDQVLAMEAGQVKDFGPKAQVLIRLQEASGGLPKNTGKPGKGQTSSRPPPDPSAAQMRKPVRAGSREPIMIIPKGADDSTPRASGQGNIGQRDRGLREGGGASGSMEFWTTAGNNGSTGVQPDAARQNSPVPKPPILRPPAPKPPILRPPAPKPPALKPPVAGAADQPPVAQAYRDQASSKEAPLLANGSAPKDGVHNGSARKASTPPIAVSNALRPNRPPLVQKGLDQETLDQKTLNKNALDNKATTQGSLNKEALDRLVMDRFKGPK